MKERWREPVIPVGVEDDPEGIVLMPDGNFRRAVKLILKQSDMDRLKEGRVCAYCYQTFERPNPEKCHVCGFPVGSIQSEYLAKNYRGEERVGPTLDMEEEQAFVDEWVRTRELAEQGFSKQGSVIIPRSL